MPTEPALAVHQSIFMAVHDRTDRSELMLRPNDMTSSNARRHETGPAPRFIGDGYHNISVDVVVQLN